MAIYSRNPASGGIISPSGGLRSTIDFFWCLRRTRMNHPHSPFDRALLIFASAVLLFIVGCHKKQPLPPPAPPAPAPVAAKPTVSISAHRTTINKGQSAKLTWTTTHATNLSLIPELSPFTPQA